MFTLETYDILKKKRGMDMTEKMDFQFFHRPCPEVARDLVGKILAHRMSDGSVSGSAFPRRSVTAERRIPPAMPTRGGHSGQK